MDTTTYVALAAQTALQKELETVANNVANANTAGFKADRSFFESFLEPLDGPGGGVSFVEDAATYIDQASGPIEVTGNPLDIALDGQGYLAVATAVGTEYTRNGHFRVGPDGTLVDADGRTVLGVDGSPIQMPDGFEDPEIRNNGDLKVTVNGRQQDVAQIGVFRPTSPNLIRKAGDGLLTAPQSEMQPISPDDGGARIVQGSIEGSTVQPMKEIANMTELTRAYERLQTMLQNESDRERKMIDTLGHPT
ncbi:MAG: flagellar basal-body rod protein FlgF [Acetobacteraceae bacterium]|jgi:flagellar basal-body rod protein FlgF